MRPEIAQAMVAAEQLLAEKLDLVRQYEADPGQRALKLSAVMEHTDETLSGVMLHLIDIGICTAFLRATEEIQEACDDA